MFMHTFVSQLSKQLYSLAHIQPTFRAKYEHGSSWPSHRTVKSQSTGHSWSGWQSGYRIPSVFRVNLVSQSSPCSDLTSHSLQHKYKETSSLASLVQLWDLSRHVIPYMYYINNSLYFYLQKIFFILKNTGISWHALFADKIQNAIFCRS